MNVRTWFLTGVLAVVVSGVHGALAQETADSQQVQPLTPVEEPLAPDDIMSIFSPGLLGAEILDQTKPEQTLITNVHVFDGVSEQRIENASVLIEGKFIKQVSTGTIDAPDAVAVDGGGGTLMPGLIDGHAHVMINHELWCRWRRDLDITDLSLSTPYHRDGSASCMDGFTTVRDMGGPTFGLARAAGHRPGPGGGPEALPLGRIHFSNLRSRRFP